MKFIKSFFLFAILEIICVALRFASVAWIQHLEEKENKKYEQIQETPTGTLILLYIVFYFLNILNIALYSVPVLIIISSWVKVFSIILFIVVVSAIIFSLCSLNAAYLEKATTYNKAKTSIIISAIINQITSNIFIVLSTSAIAAAFDLGSIVISRIHDIAWIIVFIINIVIVVKACKANSAMNKERLNSKTEADYEDYTE